MKIVKCIDGEPRIPVYWFLALLAFVGAVFVGLTVVVLHLVIVPNWPANRDPRFLYIPVFTCIAMLSWFVTGWIVQRLLRADWSSTEPKTKKTTTV